MNIEEKTLDNGLKTLFIDLPGSTSATTQIWFRAGSALEEKDNQGIAHFLEHMFFKGTPTRPGSKIAYDVESFGGEINAFTSFDYTCYYINSPAEKIKNTIEILLDMVSNPRFLKKDLLPEREVVFEEFRRAIDTPSQFNFMQINKNCFTKGYGHHILGNQKTIKNFSVSQLKKFRKDHYNISNAMLVVAGDLENRNNIEKTISKFKIPKGAKSHFPEFKLKNKSTINVHHKDVQQSCLTVCIQSQKYNTEAAASEDLALNCLGHGETSRLFKSLVTESQLASSVSASTMYFNKGGSHFLRFYFPSENTQEITEKLLFEIKNIQDANFTDEEVNKIKNQYLSSKIYERESIESFAFSLGHGFAQSGNIKEEEQFISKIRTAGQESIHKSIRHIFSQPIHFNLQVPKATNLKDQKAILKKSMDNIQKHFTVQKSTNKKNPRTKKSKYDKAVQTVKLSENIELIYRQNKMTPTFVLHSYIKGGLSHETKKINGLFSLLSRSLTYGHKDKTYSDLKVDLESSSTYMNGFSGKNAYGLTLHGLSENFKKAGEDFFQTLINPSFEEKLIGLEKELTLRSLANQKLDPIKKCFSQFNQLVFNKHPYSQNILGTEENIHLFTRDSLNDLHQKYLSSNNIVITYCGDKDINEVIELVNYQIQSIKRSPSLLLPKNDIQPISGQHTKVDFDREQTHIMIGAPSFPSSHKNELYLKMITTLLSGQSSELFVDVRDKKGLCYSCQTINHAALEAGYWGIYIGAGNDKTDLAIEAILEIINKYRDKGVSKKEFNRTKKMIAGNQKIGTQTNDDFAHYYSIAQLHGLGLDFQHKSLEKIANMDHDKFNSFLNKYFSTNWNIVEVGP